MKHHVPQSLSLLLLLPATTAVAAPKDQELSPEMMETARLSARFILQELAGMGPLRLAAYVAITAVTAILLAWWISGWFAKNRSSGKNACRLLAWSIGFGVFGLGAGVLLFQVGFAVGAVAFCAIMLGVGVLAPSMKVYELTVTKAAGFALCWFALNFVVQLFVAGFLTEGKGMPWSQLAGRTTGDRLAFLRRELARQAAEPGADAASATPAAKSAQAALDLRALYDALQKDREALDMNNKEAVAAFNQRAAEYKALSAAAAKPDPTPSGPVPPATR